MCILFIAVNQHPEYPLIIAANRDEFHARPTSPSYQWNNKVIAGKDELAGGTWMGVHPNGRIAALTNIRAPNQEVTNAVTRGELVSNFLDSQNSIEQYLHVLEQSRQRYNGFNLLFGSVNNLYVYNNFTNETHKLINGVYGLSNANLNSPWPKIHIGKEALSAYCKSPLHLNAEHLFQLLKNDTPAFDDDLPATGVPIEWERKVSSIFIQSDDYGTRSSTVMLVDNDDKVSWEERTYLPSGELSQTEKFNFALSS